MKAVFLIAAMFCQCEVKAEDVQISDKPIEANKEKKLLVCTRAEFSSLVLGNTEEQIVQLLGKPDKVLRLGAVLWYLLWSGFLFL